MSVLAEAAGVAVACGDDAVLVAAVVGAVLSALCVAVGALLGVRGELIEPPSRARRFSWPTQGGTSSFPTVHVRRAAHGRSDALRVLHSLSVARAPVSLEAWVVGDAAAGDVFTAAAVVVSVVAVAAAR